MINNIKLVDKITQYLCNKVELYNRIGLSLELSTINLIKETNYDLLNVCFNELVFLSSCYQRILDKSSDYDHFFKVNDQIKYDKSHGIYLYVFLSKLNRLLFTNLVDSIYKLLNPLTDMSISTHIDMQVHQDFPTKNVAIISYFVAFDNGSFMKESSDGRKTLVSILNSIINQKDFNVSQKHVNLFMNTTEKYLTFLALFAVIFRIDINAENMLFYDILNAPRYTININSTMGIKSLIVSLEKQMIYFRDILSNQEMYFFDIIEKLCIAVKKKNQENHIVQSMSTNLQNEKTIIIVPVSTGIPAVIVNNDPSKVSSDSLSSNNISLQKNINSKTILQEELKDPQLIFGINFVKKIYKYPTTLPHNWCKKIKFTDDEFYSFIFSDLQHESQNNTIKELRLYRNLLLKKYSVVIEAFAFLESKFRYRSYIQLGESHPIFLGNSKDNTMPFLRKLIDTLFNNLVNNYALFTRNLLEDHDILYRRLLPPPFQGNPLPPYQSNPLPYQNNPLPPYQSNSLNHEKNDT